MSNAGRGQTQTGDPVQFDQGIYPGSKSPRQGSPEEGFGKRLWDRRGRLLANYAVFGLLLILIAVYSALRPDTFPTENNFQTLVTQNSVLALVALAALPPLIVGEFDLSVAYSLGLGSMVSALLLSSGFGPAPVIVLIVVMGLVIGLANAFIVVGLKVNSFIATLGTGIIMSGISQAISGGVTVFEGIGKDYTALGTSKLFGFFPIPGLYVIAVALVLWYAYQRTPFGREMYATGFARQAARLAAVRVDLLVVVSFLIAGVLAALAGALLTARIGSASPSVGPEYLLPAFAAVFLGATSVTAGRFNVWGTVLGVALIAVGIAGLLQLGFASWITPIFNGVILIAAVALSAHAASRVKAT